jgi:aminoglycoside phosphotransferase (APT) family kinase protein
VAGTYVDYVVNDTTSLPAEPLGGRRLSWDQVPGHVRGAVEAALGAAVIEARTQEGGFSPGAASRLRLSNGGGAFVKALGVHIHRDSVGLYRREAAAMPHLPAGLPVPPLLDVYDDGEWVALVCEDVEGQLPAVPWRPEELDRVAGALADLGAMLQPTPWPDAPRFAEMEANRTFMRTWRDLAAAPPPELDPWLRDQLGRLAEQTDLAALVSGDALLHADLRSDNILLTPDGGVVFVDWAWTCNGAPWLDVVLFATTVNAEGGADAEGLVRDHPLTRDVPRAWIDAVLLAVVAVYWRLSRRPERLPHHLVYAEATLRWTRRRIAGRAVSAGRR